MYIPGAILVEAMSKLVMGFDGVSCPTTSTGHVYDKVYDQSMSELSHYRGTFYGDHNTPEFLVTIGMSLTLDSKFWAASCDPSPKESIDQPSGSI